MKESIVVRLKYRQENYLNDVQDIPRAFSPYLLIDDNAEHFLGWDFSYCDGCFTLIIESDIWGKVEKKLQVNQNDIFEYKKQTKHFIKNALYDFLSEELQIKLPYGSLTGVRPTKLYYELDEKIEYKEKYLVENYRLSKEKADLIAHCVKNQKNYKNDDPSRVGFFLNIPFCPTKCKYCSFISTEVFRVKNKLNEYVDCVKKEIDGALEIMNKKGYSVRSVYVGGGTPTSVGAPLLKEMLLPLKAFNVEFTVEAGRPDTINDEIVSCLSECGVTRVSVNPQTLHDDTLVNIGRGHTVKDFFNAYELMKKAGFSINVDLICGLPGEDVAFFKESLDGCLILRPDNLTVHTLSLKRGSVFTLEGFQKNKFGQVKEMVDYAHKTLFSNGYAPYYMYRQKNMADNLENTGYCLPGKQCLYNIDMMEESATILGVGAGAMSKMIDGNKIERFSSPKGFREYIERIDKTIFDKKTFFNL